MTKSKAKKAEPAAKLEEPTAYILLSGKFSRRLPDGTSERFYPGDEIPNPTPSELASFGDLIVPAEVFQMMASQHEQKRQNEAARKEAKQAMAAPVGEKEQDPEAAKRAKVLKEIREDRNKSSVRL